MTVAEFQALTITCAQNVDSLNKQFNAYAQLLLKLQKEDPCVKGFDEKLAQLDEAGDSLNAFGADVLNPSYKAVLTAYEELGFFDKRKPYIVDQVNLLTRTIKATVAENNKLKEGGGRKELRERYNSCTVLKDPEEKPSQEDKPADNTSSEGDNQSEDDKGSQTSGAEGGGDELGGAGAEATPSNQTSGTTVAGKSNTPQSKKSAKPNRRQQNPLGNLSSYTYNLSLYMTTPDAYSAFVASGRRDINAINNVATTAQPGTAQAIQASGAGAYLIAQSGGINNTTQKRAPGFELDYYIDNLRILSYINGKETTTSANATDVRFEIIEPYGFSFLTKLGRSRNEILKNSKLTNVKENAANMSSFKQFFILGCRFYGYNNVGNVASSSAFKAQAEVNSDAKTSGSDTALFERFYDINITSVKFRLTGRGTVYNVEGKILPEQVAFTNRYGRLNQELNVIASDVIGALTAPNITDGTPRENQIGLISVLNNQQKALLNEKKIDIANEYDIKFIGDIDDLKFAELVTDADRDKLRSDMTGRKNISDTKSPDVSIKALPNLNTRLITFRTDTPILQVISSIVAQSKFLYNAQKVVFTSDPDPQNLNEEQKEIKDEGKRIRWYNLGSIVEVKGFDTKRKDWAYKITYVIQPYETPVFDTPLARQGVPYYGPHKRYDYYFTGKNSEILKYEQQYNFSYFTVALSTRPPGEGNNFSNNPGNIPVEPQKRNNQDRTGATGEALEAQNSYLTSLYDPAAYATAKITILGDPDYLMQTQPNNISAVYDPYYGPDKFTINPNGGQVFVEVDFKEPVDYKNTDGLLSVNESIYMMPIPKQLKNEVKGVSYIVTSVASSFSRGKFEQELNCILNTFSGINNVSQNVESNRQALPNDNSVNNAETAKLKRQVKPVESVGLRPAPDYTAPLSFTPEESNITNNQVLETRTSNTNTADDDQPSPFSYGP